MTHAPILEQYGSKSALRRGADNAVRSSLAMTNQDAVVLICDEAAVSVAAAVFAAAKEVGAECQAFILEQLGERPMIKLPDEIVDAMKQATVSLYMAQSRPEEHHHRNELLELVKYNRVRHAHMINVDENVMCQGMLSDFGTIAKLNKLMIERISNASNIQVTSPIGTDVSVTLDPDEEWRDSAGVIHPGIWENLPNGEILTCPKSVDGVFYCDNFAPTKEAVDRFELGRRPLRIHMSNGLVENIDGGPGDLAARLLASSRSGTNMNRIGMFAVGTNYELLMPIGSRLQDMFVPGAYFSIGRHHSDVAASWTSDVQNAFHGRKSSLILDGVTVIDEGRYDPKILAEIK